MRRRRVTALKVLVQKRVYDVPSEEVAARIIRDAIITPVSDATRN
jgi:hypothetical protein